MSGCYQNIASNYQCLVSPFSRISRIMLIRKVRVPFSESQFLFWKLLVIDVTFDSDQLYYEHILLVVRRTGWEHEPDEQISNRRFSTLDAPEPGVPHLCIYPTLNQRYLERKKNVRKFQKFAALWQPFPRCLYHIHNNFCSTYIILVVISNLEMIWSMCEDMGYTQIRPFDISKGLENLWVFATQGERPWNQSREDTERWLYCEQEVINLGVCSWTGTLHKGKRWEIEWMRWQLTPEAEKISQGREVVVIGILGLSCASGGKREGIA